MAEQRARIQALQGQGSTPLKPEELDVLRYVAQGLTSKEIGRRLSLHRRTVEKHLTSIYRKWGVQGRGEALRIARQAGLLPPQSQGQDRQPQDAGEDADIPGEHRDVPYRHAG